MVKRRPASLAVKRRRAFLKLKAMTRSRVFPSRPKFTQGHIDGVILNLRGLADDLTGGKRPKAVNFLTCGFDRIAADARAARKDRWEMRSLLAAELTKRLDLLDAAASVGLVEAPH